MGTRKALLHRAQSPIRLIAYARLDVQLAGSLASFFLSSRVEAAVLQLVEELAQAAVAVHREEVVPALLRGISRDEVRRTVVAVGAAQSRRLM